jgi:serine protease Do
MMRPARLAGIVVGAAAIVGISLAAAAVIRGQGRGTGQDVPDANYFGLAVRPDVQLLTVGGPQIGVTVRDLDKGDGVAVDEVRNGSPAAKAGVKAGDTIVEFDGERIRSVRQLTRLVQETPAGRSVKIAVVRDGKRVDLSVARETSAAGFMTGQFRADMDKLRQELRDNLRELPREGGTFRYWVPGPGDVEILPRGPSELIERYVQPGRRLGVTVQDLTSQLATYFGAKGGVLITAVTEGSPAAKAGLKAGDVITAVNDQAVATGADLVRLLRDAGAGAEVAIALVRDRKPMTVKAKPDPTPSSPRVIRRTIVV